MSAAPANPAAEPHVERRITVVNKLGLHARAAAKLVKLAARFDSAIKLAGTAPHAGASGVKTADAKSIMDVMMLAATQGSELKLVVRGGDAPSAADAICRMFAERFGEGE